MQNKLRIIGGEWRSRVITFDDQPDLRPTPQRVRETLFNWLQPALLGSHCLDLFSGSGALGFEAASRGAKQVTQVEYNPQAVRKLQANAKSLQANQVAIVPMDVLRFLTGPAQTYDIVFLDPPFASDCAEQVCALLEQHGWLNADALCYIEVPAKRPLKVMPANWQPLKYKTAGEVGYHLYIRNQY